MQEDSTSQEPSPGQAGTEMSSRTIGVGNGALRISFERRGDRFGHRIAIAGTSGIITLLESFESAADVAWPHSPPLQELEIERRGDQKVALLVGMSGASHWSASVEVDSNCLVFDIACRTRDVATRLGSTYLIGDARLSSQSDGTVLIQTHDEKTTVELIPHDDFSTRLKLLDDNRLWIGPDIKLDKTPTTVRWQYSLRLQNG